MNRYSCPDEREKKVENYEAMPHFTCGTIVWNKIPLGQVYNIISTVVQAKIKKKERHFLGLM
ncbi:hypothetical protein MKU92_002210 [Salmonella enterica]|nr:hypothetical protein [Salmonella enterica]